MAIISGAKSRVNIVREMFFFSYMILPPITYVFQCFATTLHDDKENLMVTCSRVLEAIVSLRDGTGTGYRPVRPGPVPVRISDRPVRSDLLRPVPVPVVKNLDRFHLWLV